jgi:hypothetical protein
MVIVATVAVFLVASCQGGDQRDAQEELGRTRQQLRRARAEIDALEQERRQLLRDVKSSGARASELEGLVRELAAEGGACPIQSVPHKRPQVRAVAFPYGIGPVFVGLGTGDGVVLYTLDTMEHGGWHYYKTLWAVAPSYTGKVVITGEQIDGPNRLRFNGGSRFPGRKQFELKFSPDASEKWRYGPSATLIRAPGCYAFRIRGEGFEQRIVFEAVG